MITAGGVEIEAGASGMVRVAVAVTLPPVMLSDR